MKKRKRILIVFIFLWICFNLSAERYTVPFMNLPKTSKDGSVEFVKVLSKKYKTLSDGSVNINYIIWVSKNNIKDLIVNDIIKSNFIFYVNDNNIGRLLTKEEKEYISLSVLRDENDDFLVYLNNVSNKIFRLDIDVLVEYKDTKLVTVLELLDYEAFPTKMISKTSFFDDKDISIGKMIVIEK